MSVHSGLKLHRGPVQVHMHNLLPHLPLPFAIPTCARLAFTLPHTCTSRPFAASLFLPTQFKWHLTHLFSIHTSTLTRVTMQLHLDTVFVDASSRQIMSTVHTSATHSQHIPSSTMWHVPSIHQPLPQPCRATLSPMMPLPLLSSCAHHILSSTPHLFFNLPQIIVYRVTSNHTLTNLSYQLFA